MAIVCAGLICRAERAGWLLAPLLSPTYPTTLIDFHRCLDWGCNPDPKWVQNWINYMKRKHASTARTEKSMTWIRPRVSLLRIVAKTSDHLQSNDDQTLNSRLAKRRTFAGWPSVSESIWLSMYVCLFRDVFTQHDQSHVFRNVQALFFIRGRPSLVRPACQQVLEVGHALQ